MNYDYTRLSPTNQQLTHSHHNKPRLNVNVKQMARRTPVSGLPLAGGNTAAAGPGVGRVRKEKKSRRQ
jgi:hypothetical protein